MTCQKLCVIRALFKKMLSGTQNYVNVYIKFFAAIVIEADLVHM